MRQEIEVIRQILDGDTESFRLLVERYERPVIRMIRNITNDIESCEDIAQDVFFTAYRKLASFDPVRGNFSTWLFTITRNKSINAMKKKRALSMSELPEEGDSHNPYDEVAEKEFFRRLDSALSKLPSRQKRVFVLAELEKLPYEEIAQIEGVRVGTIKSRINRAKKRLRTSFKVFKGDIS
ncbi:MAG: sigma-70 family RNA polymerase sigma factor [Planctomycetota bacterium]|nr:MAG: sigma-70 family RNA polymerase sigma factor [Planctomycetota bacterium]